MKRKAVLMWLQSRFIKVEPSAPRRDVMPLTSFRTISLIRTPRNTCGWRTIQITPFAIRVQGSRLRPSSGLSAKSTFSLPPNLTAPGPSPFDFPRPPTRPSTLSLKPALLRPTLLRTALPWWKPKPRSKSRKTWRRWARRNLWCGSFTVTITSCFCILLLLY